MNDDNCPSCCALGHDCGGHWNRRRVTVPRGTGTRGHITLDVYDGTYEHGANAYTSADHDHDD